MNRPPAAHTGIEPTGRVSPIDRELLAGCMLLRDLPGAMLDELLCVGKRRRIDARAVVFERGAAGSDIYFLLDGGVKVSTLSSDGREVIFDVLASGDFFGEMSLFDGMPRTGTVTALVPSLLIQVDKKNFLDLLARHPAVSMLLVQTLVGRLRVMDDFIEDVMFLDAERRLAKRVSALARMFGQAGADGEIRIDLKVSQQDVANLVGITRESVNKRFRHWERAGIIAIERGSLVLLQPRALAALAGEAS
jgi:CRP-like cAMP-binding protein